jgi:nucleotide-binding universal stress UspA family protein
MKTILVPTDFSDISENAAHYAAGLARLSNARLILLHTYSLMAPLTEAPVSDVQMEEVGRINEKFLRIFDAKLKSVYTDIETELRTSIGFMVEEVLSVAEEENVDLIVMGKAGPGKPYLNTNILSIIRQTQRTVLAIPENVKYKAPEKIALACDYSSEVRYEVIQRFKDFAKLFTAKVLVFDVLKKSEVLTVEKAMVEENLAESISDMDYALYYPSGNNVVNEIDAFIHENKVDILCMIPHKYNFLSGLFHNSSTKQITLKADIPLLIVHEEERQ